MSSEVEAEPAPIYLSDLLIIKMFANKMIDGGSSITQDQMFRFLRERQLWTHMNQASPNVMQLMVNVPEVAQVRIVEMMANTYGRYISDVGSWWLSQGGNGYNLLLALIFELEKSELTALHRPSTRETE